MKHFILLLSLLVLNFSCSETKKSEESNSTKDSVTVLDTISNVKYSDKPIENSNSFDGRFLTLPLEIPAKGENLLSYVNAHKPTDDPQIIDRFFNDYLKKDISSSDTFANQYHKKGQEIAGFVYGSEIINLYPYGKLATNDSTVTHDLILAHLEKKNGDMAIMVFSVVNDKTFDLQTDCKILYFVTGFQEGLDYYFELSSTLNKKNNDVILVNQKYNFEKAKEGWRDSLQFDLYLF